MLTKINEKRKAEVLMKINEKIAARCRRGMIRKEKRGKKC